MRCLLAVALLVALPAAAHADDPLMRFAPWFATVPSGMVFHYSSPQEGFTPDAPTLQGPVDEGLRQVLLDQEGVDPTSGVDRDTVTGVMTVGSPPDDLLVLTGEFSMSVNIGPALIERGFEKREILGVSVFGRGPDHALDVAASDLPDPFAGGGGRAQRVAVADGYVAVARSWDGADLAIRSLTDPRGSALIWQATLEALSDLRGNGRLDAAWGWGGDNFEGALLGPTPLPASSGQGAPGQGEATMLFPPFPLAIFALDRDGVEAHLRIALPYGRPDEARAAAQFVAARLAEYPGVEVPAQTTIVEKGDLAIVAITLDYSEARVGEANRLMLDWSVAAMQRDFAPLQYGLF